MEDGRSNTGVVEACARERVVQAQSAWHTDNNDGRRWRRGRRRQATGWHGRRRRRPKGCLEAWPAVRSPAQRMKMRLAVGGRLSRCGEPVSGASRAVTGVLAGGGVLVRQAHVLEEVVRVAELWDGNGDGGVFGVTTFVEALPRRSCSLAFTAFFLVGSRMSGSFFSLTLTLKPSMRVTGNLSLTLLMKFEVGLKRECL
uniref:Uncharacterized protein n=1 Tax=Oryza meridionalis TaxID=40149 RepID=A0A0E0DLL2_9ORYZ